MPGGLQCTWQTAGRPHASKIPVYDLVTDVSTEPAVSDESLTHQQLNSLREDCLRNGGDLGTPSSCQQPASSIELVPECLKPPEEMVARPAWIEQLCRHLQTGMCHMLVTQL